MGRHGNLATVTPIRTQFPVMSVRGGDSQLIEEFLTFKAGENCSDRTLGSYRSILTRLEQTVGPLAAATHEQIDSWLRSQALKASSRATYLTAIRSFYEWAILMEYMHVNPTYRVPSPTLPRRFPRGVSLEQFRIIVDSAKPMMRCWLLLGGLAGLRRREITYIRAENILYSEKRLFVTEGTKGGHQRFVPLNAELAAALRDWNVQVGRLWLRHESTVGDSIARHMRRNGVDATCHQLRHFFATWYLDATGGEVMRVQRALGHQNLNSTQIYADMRDDDNGAIDGLAM